MTRRVAVIVLALFIATAFVSPAIGGPSVESIAKQALGLAKKNKNAIAKERGRVQTFTHHGYTIPPETVLNAGDLELKFSCFAPPMQQTGGGSIVATTAVDDAKITVGGTHDVHGAGATAFENVDDDFDTGEEFIAGLNGNGGFGNSYESGQLTYTTPDEDVVTVAYDETEKSLDCRISGTSIGP